MIYDVNLSKSAEKELYKLPKSYYLKIRNAIDNLAENPRPIACLKLTNKGNQYRIRVGVYRIIYSIFDEQLVIDIIAIGHRKDINK